MCVSFQVVWCMTVCWRRHSIFHQAVQNQFDCHVSFLFSCFYFSLINIGKICHLMLGMQLFLHHPSRNKVLVSYTVKSVSFFVLSVSFFVLFLSGLILVCVLLWSYDLSLQPILHQLMYQSQLKRRAGTGSSKLPPSVNWFLDSTWSVPFSNHTAFLLLGRSRGFFSNYYSHNMLAVPLRLVQMIGQGAKKKREKSQVGITSKFSLIWYALHHWCLLQVHQLKQ